MTGVSPHPRSAPTKQTHRASHLSHGVQSQHELGGTHCHQRLQKAVGMHPSGSWALKAGPAPVFPLRRPHGGRGVGRAGLSARLCEPYTDGSVRWLWHLRALHLGREVGSVSDPRGKPAHSLLPAGPCVGRWARFTGLHTPAPQELSHGVEDFPKVVSLRCWGLFCICNEKGMEMDFTGHPSGISRKSSERYRLFTRGCGWESKIWRTRVTDKVGQGSNF